MIKHLAITAIAAASLGGIAAASPRAATIAPEPIGPDDCAAVSGYEPGAAPVVAVINCIPDGMTIEQPYTMLPATL